ncbi:Beta-N-acetylhexosaminidase [Pseudopedobacter saltans DSM 12145]|uniref:beta-N-acetylhexosaminidase n=2 Tax=Pseudopedobacter saltans TaxID=151895 RepID=F0SAM1_PSESL|nr:Beta-N-acetylhexosaminidase [Pseudopedobacter saltans DSM 12145]
MKHKIKLLVFFYFCSILWVFGAKDRLNIIPYPNKVQIYEGFCDLSKGVNVVGGELIKKQTYSSLEHDFGILQNKSGIKLSFLISPEITNKEGYVLNIDYNAINIKASSKEGHFYALQTLKQLVSNKKLPRVEIIDEPRFSWRSFMLDEARYFHGKKVVKNLLDEMAALKMNTFHWHLTDDAGWRIDIKKYPLLTKIGAKRDSTQIEDPTLQVPGETGDPAYDEFLRRYQSNKFDGKLHQGYYSHSDIKEIVAYARDRGIQIIPEISMPGHASAAIAAYPWLGTLDQKIKVPTRFGVMENVFDPSSKKTIQFFKDVLAEVSSLFPAPYIHIGGDEVKHNQWKASENITKYMTENNLKNYKDVQVKFTNEISDYVEKELGKSIIGWSEILGVDTHVWQKDTGKVTQQLSKNAIVQFWSGNKDILKYALDNNYKVVNSYHEDTYLNYSYDQLPLKKSYSLQVVPQGYERSSVIGLGCQLWTEWISDMAAIQYHIFPRIAAYAELGWTKEEYRSYDRFLLNLKPLVNKWKEKGYNLPENEFN